jgi:hypothetical protein
LGVAKTVVVGVAVTVFVGMTVAGGVIEGKTVGVAVEDALGIVWFWHMFWAMLNSNSRSMAVAAGVVLRVLKMPLESLGFWQC